MVGTELTPELETTLFEKQVEIYLLRRVYSVL